MQKYECLKTNMAQANEYHRGRGGGGAHEKQPDLLKQQQRHTYFFGGPSIRSKMLTWPLDFYTLDCGLRSTKIMRPCKMWCFVFSDGSHLCHTQRRVLCFQTTTASYTLWCFVFSDSSQFSHTHRGVLCFQTAVSQVMQTYDCDVLCFQTAVSQAIQTYDCNVLCFQTEVSWPWGPMTGSCMSTSSTRMVRSSGNSRLHSGYVLSAYPTALGNTLCSVDAVTSLLKCYADVRCGFDYDQNNDSSHIACGVQCLWRFEFGFNKCVVLKVPLLFSQ